MIFDASLQSWQRPLHEAGDQLRQGGYGAHSHSTRERDIDYR